MIIHDMMMPLRREAKKRLPPDKVKTFLASARRSCQHQGPEDAWASALPRNMIAKRIEEAMEGLLNEYPDS